MRPEQMWVQPDILASACRTGRCDCSTRQMISSFSEPGYLIPRLPHPRSCFFSPGAVPAPAQQRPPSERGPHGEGPSPRCSWPHGAVSPASRAPLAGFQELLRPAVIETFGDAFPTAQLGNTALPSQAVQTMRIFSAAEYCLRVARRMFFTRRPDEEVGVLEFCLTSFP